MNGEMCVAHWLLLDIKIFLRKHPIKFKIWGKMAFAGMSDCTQDQLYLAFRLASLEKFSAEGEPLPFAERP